jgi:hypothetical protein
MTNENLTLHRRQLRRILGISWPHRISNTRLYEMTGEKPVSLFVTQQRWRLFGHVLRSHPESPANKAMQYFFEPVTMVERRFKIVHQGSLRSTEDFTSRHHQPRPQASSNTISTHPISRLQMRRRPFILQNIRHKQERMARTHPSNRNNCSRRLAAVMREIIERATSKQARQ